MHVRDLERDLRAVVDGDVRFDPVARGAYSTDGSNYRQVPLGVVLPSTPDDAVAAVEVCRRHGAPLTSRGGGTSLAGQACNVAVILDWSKYCHRLVSVDADRKTCVVEPGIVLDTLNEQLAGHDLMFGPRPATHDHCTLGGMIGNNSCGVHRTGLRQDCRQRRAPGGPHLRRDPHVGRPDLGRRARRAGGRRRTARRALPRPARDPRHLRRQDAGALPRHPPARLRLQPRLTPARARLPCRPRPGRLRGHPRHRPACRAAAGRRTCCQGPGGAGLRRHRERSGRGPARASARPRTAGGDRRPPGLLRAREAGAPRRAGQASQRGRRG